jgi:hypothetical protein
MTQDGVPRRDGTAGQAEDARRGSARHWQGVDSVRIAITRPRRSQVGGAKS